MPSSPFKTKIFRCGSVEEMEKEINKWLESDIYADIHGVTQSESFDSAGKWWLTVMICYLPADYIADDDDDPPPDDEPEKKKGLDDLDLEGLDDLDLKDSKKEPKKPK